MDVLPFIHPGLAAGALAASAIPLIIHFFSRRRFQRVPWAAMRFLQAAYVRSARRLRWEQWLLLMMRVLVVVLLGAAAARPFVASGGFFPEHLQRMHRILVVDDSLSMQASTAEGRTRFDAAREAAGRMLEVFPPADAVSIVTVAGTARAVVDEGSRDRRLVRQVVESLKATQLSGNWLGAISMAHRISQDSIEPPGNQAVYLLSDFSGAEWAAIGAADAGAGRGKAGGGADALARAMSELAGAAAGRSPGVMLVPVGDAAPNLAVVALKSQSPFTAVGMPLRLEVDIANFGPRTAAAAVLQLRRNEEILRREPLPSIEPGATCSLSLAMELPVAGVHLIDATLSGIEGDALAVDNTRRLSLEARERVPLLLVEGGAESGGLGAAYFLRRALAPESAQADESSNEVWQRADGGQDYRPVFEVSVIGAADLSTEALPDHAAVMLCNVGRLPDATWSALRRYVAEGGGLAVFVGDQVDGADYQRILGELLPGRLLTPRSANQPVDGSPDQEGATLLTPPLVHPIVAEFQGFADSGLFQSRVWRFMPLEGLASGDETVLALSTGDPALVVGKRGAGRVMLMATSADMSWTNLPARGDFVSLMLNATAYLIPQRGTHRNIDTGTSIREPLEPRETSLSLLVQTTGGPQSAAELATDEGGVAAVFGPVEQAGAPRMTVGGDSRWFAVNSAATESDVRVPDGRRLAEVLGSSVAVLNLGSITVAAASRGSKVELATLGLWALLGLLVTEMWLAMSFGRRRGHSGHGSSSAGDTQR